MPDFGAVARVLDESGGVIGGGFRVEADIVLTCAHVVSDALNLPRGTTPPKDARVPVDFPKAPRAPKASAEIIHWMPDEDMAVLEIDAGGLDDVPVARLAARPIDKGERFDIHGFPAGYSEGRNERGEVTGSDARGYLEIRPERTDAHDFFVEPGFSGTPAFDREGRVIGMTILADPKNRVAHLIPIPILEKAWPPLARPYRGLAAFDENSARWFRGRDDFTRRILKAVGEWPVVAVVGASGVGKSSVVKAGVIPALRKDGWTVVECRVGERPAEALAKTLIPKLCPTADAWTREEHERTLTDYLRTAPERAAGKIGAFLRNGERLLIVLDQFEELATRADEDERAAFDRLLLQMIKGEDTRGLRMILTLRADYVEEIKLLDCARYLLNDGRVELTPLNRAELMAAIADPARELGVAFKDGIDGELAGHVRSAPGLLPLLQYMLAEAWSARGRGHAAITEETLDALGGMEGVLGRKADEVLSRLSERDRDNARRLFADHLVVVSDTGVDRDTKRVATRAEVGEELWTVVQSFAAPGVWLLLTDRAEGNGGATVELLHEALIRNWPTLRDWLNDVRERRLWEEEIRRDAARANDGVDDIWNPGQMERAERLLSRPDIAPDVRDRARRVIARTRAESMWRRLRDHSGFEAAVDELPALENETRAVMIEHLRAKADCAEAFLRDPARVAFGLFGIDPERRLNMAEWIAGPSNDEDNSFSLRARCQLGIALGLFVPFNALMSALRETTNFSQCEALGEVLSEVAARVTDADAFADALLSELRGTKDSGQCAALGEALSKVAARVTDAEAFADALLSALRGTKDFGQCVALGAALSEVAARVTDADALAEELLSALLGTKGSGQCLALRAALSEVAARVTDADALAEALLSALRTTKDSDQLWALGAALSRLASRVTDADAVADGLLSASRAMTDYSQRGTLGAALSEVAARVTDADAFADALLSELRGTTDSEQCETLGAGLRGVAARVTDADALTEALLSTLCGTTNYDQCVALGAALSEMTLRVKDADTVAHCLLSALHGMTDYSQCTALGPVLSRLGSRVTNVDAFADRLTSVLRDTSVPDQWAALGAGLASLVREADAFADELLSVLRKTMDPDQCEALSVGLSRVASRMISTDALADKLLSSLRETTDLNQCWALGAGLSGLAARLSNPDQAARTIVDLCDQNCAYEELAVDFLTAVARKREARDGLTPFVVGCARLAGLRCAPVERGAWRWNEGRAPLTLTPSPLVEALKEVFQRDTLYEAVEEFARIYREAGWTVDLSRPWPEPIADPPA